MSLGGFEGGVNSYTLSLVDIVNVEFVKAGNILFKTDSRFFCLLVFGDDTAVDSLDDGTLDDGGS